MSKKSFADDGWAVWLDGNNTATVYLNDYINPLSHSYIDFALRIRDAMANKSLNIFVPFSVSEDEIIDSSLLLKDERILTATFNTGCIIDFMKNSCTSEIAYNRRTIDLVHISKLGYTLKPLANGTLITVDFEKLREFLDNDDVYILFRLPHKSLDEVFHRQVDVGSALERIRDLITTPVVSEKYGYSVRVNESNLLPVEINRIGAFHRETLKKTVITLAVNDDYEVNDHGCYRIRRLEESLYKDFVQEDFSCEDVIAYQWNQTQDYNHRGHFNFYFNIQNEYVSHASMLIYLFLLFIVSAATNLFLAPFQILFGL